MSRTASLLLVISAAAAAQDGGALDGGAPVPLTPAIELARRTTKAELINQLLEDGRYVRFGTDDKGPVHVWWPKSYKPSSAVTVIYLHGFYDSGDTAFLNHRLATQFRDSGLNALFIVPEAPSWRTDDVFWKDLPALLDETVKRARVMLPDGPIWVVAHSGAYRTCAQWLTHEKLERIILVDALYGADDDFARWLEISDGRKRQLVLVGFDTAQRTEWFLHKHPDAVKLDDVPYLFDTFTPAQRNARILSMTSERFAHMELITEGKVMPYLLHAFAK